MEEKDIKNIIKAAHAGGKVLRRYFGKAVNSTEKSAPADLQTKADVESEKSILKILRKGFPKYNIHSEEIGKINKNSAYTFIIDPMDGTNNFVMGMPNFSVSIGLLKNNKAVVGVIYQPILDQTYHALVGQGAFLNNKKIKVNNVLEPKDITVAYVCGYEQKMGSDYVAKSMSKLINAKHKRVSWNWSVACDLCMLANGKIESVINDDTEIHDYAAGKLIAQEAGAKVIDFSGKKETDYTNSKFIISNTNKTNKYFFEIIKPLQKKLK